jgi:hypothetical protein
MVYVMPSRLNRSSAQNRTQSSPHARCPQAEDHNLPHRLIEGRRRCALQQNRMLNVRFGSKADIARGNLDVRFTPKSGHC